MDVVAHIFPLPRHARHLAPITFDMVRIIFSDNIYIDLNRNRRAAVKINFTYLLLCFLSFEIFDRTKTNNKMFHLTLETYYNLEGDCVLFYFFTIFFFVRKLLTCFWTMRNLTKYTGQKNLLKIVFVLFG